MVQNGIFWTNGEKLYTIDYPIISYQKIKVYRVETMDMWSPIRLLKPNQARLSNIRNDMK